MQITPTKKESSQHCSVILLITILFFGSIKAYSQSNSEKGLPLITNYSTKVYKGHPQVWSIVQDNEGMMYFGTSSGITEYDGVNWRQIKLPGALGATNIRSLAKSEKGVVFYGSSNDFGFLQKDQQGSSKAHSLMEFVPENFRDFTDIWSIIILGESVYFQAREFVFKLDSNEEKSNWNIKAWKPETLFMQGFNLYGEYYVHQQDKGFYLLVNDVFEFIPGSEIFKDNRVFTALPYPGTPKGKKQYLIGKFYDHLYLFDGEEFHPFQTDLDEVLKSTILYKSLQLPDGNYVLSMIGEGIAIINQEGKMINSLGFDSGLQDGSVYSNYLDQSGLLWLGLDNGITKVELNSQMTTFSKESGLRTGVLSMERVNGDLYIGTPIGLYHLDNINRSFEIISEIPPDQIFSLIKDGDDLLIPSEGLSVLSNKKVDLFQLGRDVNFSTVKAYLSNLFPNTLYVIGSGGVTVFKKIP